MRGIAALLVGCVPLMLAAPALAQTDGAQAAGEPLVYDAEFFAQFSPANALQLVERVPGFTLESGSTEMRGFAGAAGNVVINGRRPSSKSDSLETILGRIPASRVLRVELAPGDRFGSDFVGKPQVLNLVLSEEGGLAGTVEGKLTREYTGRILPRGAGSLVYRRGDSTFDAAASYTTYNLFSEEGYDVLSALPAGTEIEYRDRTRRNTEYFTEASLGWALERAEGMSAHLNGKLSFDKWLLDDVSDIQRAVGETGEEIYTEDHLWRTYEISGDIAVPLGGGSIKLNALGTHRHRRNDDWLDRSTDGQSTGGFYQDFDDYRDERLARLAWSHGDLRGWNVEIGAEGAFNRLRTDLNVFDVDADGDRTLVDLPIDQATVSEYRGEGFVNAGRAVAQDLRLDLALNFEVSRLKVTGDVSEERTLRFLKPKAAVNWSPGVWNVQLSAERTVAQLQFADFVSGSSFNTGQVDGGNAELEPQRKWEFLITANRPILGDGRVKLDLGYNAVSRVQDRIPLKVVDPVTGELVNSGLDAPGNLGNGSEFIAKANIDLPLVQLGITGGRLSLYGSYLDTSVRDPYTMDYRPFSGTQLFAYSASFRQDLESFAWGVELAGNTGSTGYRLAETDESQGVSPKVNAFIEYRPTSKSTVTLGAENLTNAAGKRWRTFYDPDRSTPDPYRLEYRERNTHVQVYLSIRHSFG